MRNPGLEPGSLAALEPESSASAIPPVPLATVFIDSFLSLRNFLLLSSVNITLAKSLKLETSFSEDGSNQNIIFREHLSYFTEYLILHKTTNYLFFFVKFLKRSKSLLLLLFSPYLSSKKQFFSARCCLKTWTN